MQLLTIAYDSVGLQRCGFRLPASGFRLLERLRRDVPPGKSCWGAKGELDLAKLRGRAGPSAHR